MKRTYLTPQTELIPIDSTQTLLAGSFDVTGDDLGGGGGGTDPARAPFLESPEELLNLPVAPVGFE